MNHMKQNNLPLKNSLKTTLIIWVWLGLVFNVHAQDTTQSSVVPAIIDGEHVLSAGKHTIATNVLVAPSGSLKIMEGAQIFFNRNTRIEVKGELVVSGSQENRVKITSNNHRLPGKGFIISGANPNARIGIQHADFSHLSSPITFQINWVRSSVSIKGNTFFQNETSRAVVEVQGVDPFLSVGVTPVEIKQNTFSNNSGNLFVSNIVTQEMQVTVVNNVFTRNHFYEEVGSTLFRNPLFIRYNEFGLEANNSINNNSIFDNFYTSRKDSSQTSKRTSVNVVGTGARLNLTGNYLGNPANNELALTMESSGAFFKMPFIEYQADLEKPSADLNGHIYQIYINNQLLNTDEQWLALNDIDSVSFVFNRPVIDQPIGIHQFYLSDEDVKKTAIDADYKWSENNTRLDISIINALKAEKGYLVISDLFDNNGTPISTIEMGKKHFASKRKLAYAVGVPIENKPKETVNYAMFPTVIAKDEEELPEDMERYRKIHYAPGEWEVGFYAGMPIYFGDLFTEFPLIIDPTHTGQRSIFSPRVNYNPKGSKFSYEGRLNAFLLEGSDNRDSRVGEYRGTGFDRNLSFRTIVAGLSGIVNYDFRNPRIVGKWIPGFHGGFDVFYFQPQGRYNGAWYNLRPIGTEGQTVDGKSDEYAYVSAGVPMGFHFNRYFNTKWKFQFSFTYTQTFTDYLDDAGNGSYPDEAALRAANPDNPDAAVALSNPSGGSGIRTGGDFPDAYAFWGFAVYYNINPKNK